MRAPSLDRCVGAALLAAAASCAVAQTYPSRPVRVIVPFTAGSQTDVTARIITARMSDHWKQQVVVDNRTGAGGTIGTNIVAESTPDGYTLLIHSSGYAIAPALYPKWKVDVLRDFQAISLLVSSPHILLASPTLGPKTVKEFIDYARNKGPAFTWSSAGVGSGTHFVGEKFFLATKLQHAHVAYKGTPEAMLDAITGRVDVFFSPLGPAVPFVKDGKALALAVTSKKRSATVPNVPTVDEAGVPGFEFTIWFLLTAPAKTPKPVIDTLSKEVRRILALPDVIRSFESQGAVVEPRTPAETQAFVAAEVKVLGEVARAAKVPTF